MKKWLALVALVAPLMAAVALAQVSRFVVEDGDGGVSGAANLIRGQGSTTLGRHQCAANSCTRAAPSNSSSPQEGVVLSGVGSYIITSSLSTGTFSGAGTIELWVYVDDSGNGGPSAGWFYVMGADIVPTSGKSSIMTKVQPVSLRPGSYRLVARTNAVTTSAAAPVLSVSIRACQTATCAP
jgi:hypothetical protein